MPKSRNSLSFHRPEAKTPEPSKESLKCIRGLSAYHAPSLPFHSELGASPRSNKLQIPRSRRAAVLVAIFVGRAGDLYVLLSRRSAALRAYAGDTALPGGKVDSTDRYLEETARREAFEEIGLSMDPTKVPLLCILEPFLAGPPNRLSVVTPVVVLIMDNTLRPILNAAEVSSIFSHPLASFLSSDAPFPLEQESLEVPYHSFVDLELESWPTDVHPKIRMHRFLTGREAGGVKPVFGLTAAILIRVAMVGYRKAPDFDVYPVSEDPEDSFEPSPKTVSVSQRIAHAMLTIESFNEGTLSDSQRKRLKDIAYGAQLDTKHTRPYSSSSRRRRPWFAWRAKL